MTCQPSPMPNGAGRSRSRHERCRRPPTSPTVASTSSNCSGSPNHDRNASATALGLGQPMEHVLRSWLISARLGDHMGVKPDDRGALYYVATLAWVGCVADTAELATWFGDDIAFRGDSRQVDLAGLPMLGFMLRHVGAGNPAMHRFRLAVNLVVTGGKGVERV